MPYTWLDEVPSIRDRHTPEDLRREAAGRLPAKIVFVECGAPWFEELKWVEQTRVHGTANLRNRCQSYGECQELELLRTLQS